MPERLHATPASLAQAREANELAAEADRLADLARQLREKARQAQDAAKRLPGDVKARPAPELLARAWLVHGPDLSKPAAMLPSCRSDQPGGHAALMPPAAAPCSFCFSSNWLCRANPQEDRL